MKFPVLKIFHSLALCTFCLAFTSVACAQEPKKENLPAEEAQTPIPVEEAAEKVTTSAEPTTVPAKKKIEKENPLNQISRRYRQNRGVEMNVTKNTLLSVLKKTKTSTGNVQLSKGKLRMELTQPDRSLLVYDKTQIWVVDYPPEELGGVPQVGHMKVAEKSKDHALLSLLSGEADVWNDLKLKEKTVQNSSETHLFLPKDSKKFPGVTKIQIQVDSKKLQIEKIAYWDDIENKTEFIFSDVQFDKKISASAFNFSPPKDAQVTQY